jgi:hypothetical protein
LRTVHRHQEEAEIHVSLSPRSRRRRYGPAGRISVRAAAWKSTPAPQVGLDQQTLRQTSEK